MTMRRIAALAACLALASCATQAPPASGSAGGAVPKNSAECLAAPLRPLDPLPVGAIPDELLRRAQSGWVAVAYDVVAGRARNARVVGSQPPGLYDSFVLRHVGAYTDPGGATVRGCVTTTHIRF